MRPQPNYTLIDLTAARAALSASNFSYLEHLIELATVNNGIIETKNLLDMLTEIEHQLSET